mmetsp:Transcript_107551/g.302752  ORF Transcript_107551/g.302752 Transcript_107551/m.302752 type:complete len:543 (-) Transcript_107551:7-1635(-)
MAMAPPRDRQQQHPLPLVGPTLRRAAEQHARDVDGLGSELQDLRLRYDAAEPEIAQELRQVRSLRRDVESTRREAQLCKKALEQHRCDLAHWESAVSDAAAHVVSLEGAASRQVEANPTLRWQMRIESEAEELREERDELVEQIWALDVGSHGREQQVRTLSAAVAHRGIEFGIMSPQVLYGLGDAQERLEGMGKRTVAANVATGDLADNMRSQRVQLDETRCSYFSEVARISRLDAVIQGAKASQEFTVAGMVREGEAKANSKHSAFAYADEHRLRREQLYHNREALEALQQMRSELRVELDGTEDLLQQADASYSNSARSWEEWRALLCARFSEQRSQFEMDEVGARAQLHAAEELRFEALLLSREVAESETAVSDLERWGNRAVAEDRSALYALGDEESANARLLAAHRRVLESCEAFEADLCEERTLAFGIRDRAWQLYAERENASEEVSAAMRRCEATLDATRVDANMQRDRELCIGAQLASRAALQTSLARDVSEATQELRDLQASRAALLREVAGTRQENVHFQAMLSCADGVST